MAETRIKSALGILALVAAAGGAFALFAQRDDQRSKPAASSAVASAAPVPELLAAAPEPPVKLGSVRVADVREHFAASDYSFEDKPLPGNVARVVGTWDNGRTVLEFVGSAGIEQATLRYKFEPGHLGGQDLHAIMHLMERVRASEAYVAWGIEAARKGEPATRTMGTVTYAIQRGPDGTAEFVMKPAPGFE